MQLLNNKYLKIMFLLAVSFLISDFSIKNLFLANSPKLNPYAGQDMLAKVNNLMSKTASLVAFKSINFNMPMKGSVKDLPAQTVEALSAPLTKVSTGVYAAESNGIKVYEIRPDEITYLVYIFTVHGKQVQVKIPKGDSPPSQVVLDQLYK